MQHCSFYLSILVSTLVALVSFSAMPLPRALAGNAGGNGGDFFDLLRADPVYQHLLPGAFSEDATTRYLKKFSVRAIEGFIALRRLQRYEHEFADGRVFDDAAVYEALSQVVSGGIRFKLQRNLMLNGKKVVAINSRNLQLIQLDPGEWDSLQHMFKGSCVHRLQAALAIHEVLSIMDPPLERTGDYALSMSILNYEQHALAANFFGKSKGVAPRYPEVRFSPHEMNVYAPADTFLSLNELEAIAGSEYFEDLLDRPKDACLPDK